MDAGGVQSSISRYLSGLDHAPGVAEHHHALQLSLPDDARHRCDLVGLLDRDGILEDVGLILLIRADGDLLGSRW